MPDIDHPLLQLLRTLATPSSDAWEGVFRGRSGSVRAQTASVKASLSFFQGAVEGHGRSVDFPLPGAAPDRMFTLTGTIGGSDARFDVWFEWPRLARAPFECRGALSSRGDELRGSWRLRCFTEGCACGGGGGDFHLRRVKRPG